MMYFDLFKRNVKQDDIDCLKSEIYVFKDCIFKIAYMFLFPYILYDLKFYISGFMKKIILTHLNCKWFKIWLFKYSSLKRTICVE